MTLLERNQYLALPGPQPSHTWSRSSEAVDPLSFSYLLKVMRRRWRTFVVVLAVSLVIAVLLTRILPVRYAADTRLMVDPRPRGSPITASNSVSSQPDADIVDTEVKVMTSPVVLKAVADRLNLGQDKEFAAPRSARDPGQAVIEKLGRHLAITREGLTYIVTVHASSHDRHKAAQIANAVADEYLHVSRQQRAELAAEQARTLTAELGPLGRQVVEADEAVAAYRAAHGIVASSSSAGGTVTDQQVATIAAELGKASAEAAAARATAAAASAESANAGAESVSQVLNSDSLSELRKQRAQVMRDQAQIATVYGPQHPASVRINEQLAKLNREIDEAAHRVVRGLQSDASAASAREATLRGQLAALQGRQEVDSEANVVALGLQRDADAKRGIYNDLNRNAQEQAQEARIGDVRAYIVSAAEAPGKPAFPKTSIFLMLGLMIGSAAGVGAVAVQEARERGFRTAEEIEAALQLPFLAGVPELPAATTAKGPPLGGGRRERLTSPWDYVLEKPVSSFAESIRNIRATLMAEEPRGPGGRTVCITSALSGEGKSVLAVALARVMAMSGDRVLLIDCDLRRSGLAGLRPDESRPGLMEVLHGEADTRSALSEDIVEGLNFLGQDGPVFTPKDIFSGPAAKEMIQRLEAEYDFVILDAPPVLAVTDAWTISSLCQATLLVVRHAKTPRAAVRSAVERLRLRGARLHGVVLNRRTRGSLDESGYYDSVHANYYVD
jgi:capsular exopolysaccharide synthesis family protein